MIIEIKIEIVIFTKIKLNRNCDFASYSCNFVKAELVSNSKTLQRLALLLNEVETHFASSGLNFDIHNITSPIPQINCWCHLYVSLCENFQWQSCSRTIPLSDGVYMLGVNEPFNLIFSSFQQKPIATYQSLSHDSQQKMFIYNLQKVDYQLSNELKMNRICYS